MNIGPPSAINDPVKRYAELKAQTEALHEKSGSGTKLTDREAALCMSGMMAEMAYTGLRIVKSLDEVDRINASKTLKDRFKRFRNLGFVMPNIDDPAVIRAACAEVMRIYDGSIEAYDARAALLAEQQQLADKQEKLSAEKAAQLAQLQQECQKIDTAVAGGTAATLKVGKPLKLKVPA